MNRNDDMKDVKGSAELRRQIAEYTSGGRNHIRGIFGDTVGGRSFTDDEAATLEARSSQVRAIGAGWHECWAGPGTTCWTVIDCTPDTAAERAEYEAALSSM